LDGFSNAYGFAEDFIARPVDTAYFPSRGAGHRVTAGKTDRFIFLSRQARSRFVISITPTAVHRDPTRHARATCESRSVYVFINGMSIGRRIISSSVSPINCDATSCAWNRATKARASFSIETEKEKERDNEEEQRVKRRCKDNPVLKWLYVILRCASLPRRRITQFARESRLLKLLVGHVIDLCL